MFKTEAMMYPFIKKYLEDNHWRVRSEVLKFDVVGNQDETLTIIEMKLVFSMHLIYQACIAHKFAHYVWVALPDIEMFAKTSAKKKTARKKIKEMTLICQRMNLGLLLVSDGLVRPVVKPGLSAFYNMRYGKKILKESNGRPVDENVGGTTGVTLMTSYRYNVIRVAQALIGSQSGQTAKELGSLLNLDSKEVYNILYCNYYKWFRAYSRGHYGLTDKGAQEILTYS